MRARKEIERLEYFDGDHILYATAAVAILPGVALPRDLA
jgi:hypothetical protein